MGGRAFVATIVCVTATAVAGCRRVREEAPAAPAPSPAAAAIEWAGCAVVRTGPRCELGPERRLTIWVPDKDGAAWRFEADGRPIEPASRAAMQDGSQVTLDVPKGAREVRAKRAGADKVVWSLAVGDAALDPEVDRLILAGKTGDREAAAQLRRMIETGEPGRRTRAEAAYGRVMLARGEMGEAEPALRRALAADRAEGRLSDEMRDGVVLLWALAEQQQRFADARTVLEELARPRGLYPEGRFWYAYGEGLLAVETGDLRNALASYRTAADAAERLGLIAFANDAEEDIALVLSALGRFEEAVSILERLPAKQDPCAQASLMINRAEALVAAAARGLRIQASRLQAALVEEERAVDACPEPRRRLFAAVHAADHALLVGDRGRAEEMIGRLRRDNSTGDTLTRALRAGVLGRAALARGDARAALALFDEQAAIAHAGGIRSSEFRAEVSAGEALLALRRRGEAIVRLKSAQRLQAEMLEDVPLAEGRGAFLSSHEDGVRHLVDALVDGGAAGEAMAVARTARIMEVSHAAKLDQLRNLSPDRRRRWDEALGRHARIRRAIEEESAEEWKLPTATLARARRDREIRAAAARDALDAAYRLLVDAPTAPEPALPGPVPRDQVTIAFFPVPKGWIAFAQTRTRVLARRFEQTELTSNAAAGRVLERLWDVLDGARRARVLTYGLADLVDWHAVPWRGTPLGARVIVSYGLDLPGREQAAPGSDLSREALLVVNPTGDLPAAAREGDLVARTLEGWRVSRLEGSAATRDAILRALPKVALFHYAGHAEAGGAAGPSGALVLPQRTRADVGDLLALPRMPPLVVLSACQAASANVKAEDGRVGSILGLAQTFLAAGAQMVVAPTREVADKDAQEFVAAFYRALREHGPGAHEEAFQAAAAGAVGGSAESFRLLVN